MLLFPDSGQFSYIFSHGSGCFAPCPAEMGKVSPTTLKEVAFKKSDGVGTSLGIHFPLEVSLEVLDFVWSVTQLFKLFSACAYVPQSSLHVRDGVGD